MFLNLTETGVNFYVEEKNVKEKKGRFKRGLEILAGVLGESRMLMDSLELKHLNASHEIADLISTSGQT